MAPDQSMATAIKNGNDFYNMLVQHQIARAHGKREEEASARNEAANQRAEKMQPYTIKQMLSQMANASAANARNAELLPFKKELMRAQAGNAASNASWNNMLMGGGAPNAAPNPEKPTEQNYDALKDMFQGQGMPRAQEENGVPNGMQGSNEQKRAPMQPMTNEERIIRPGDPSRAMLNRFAGIKGIPPIQSHYEDGNLITMKPNGEVTSQKVGPSKEELAREEGLNKVDVGIVDEMQHAAIEGQDLSSDYQDLSSLYSNPDWAKLQTGLLSKGGERGRKWQMDVLRNFGTQEQKDMIAMSDSKTNEIVTKMAKVFKGPFRIGEQSLIERIKPQTYDTPEAQKAKLKALQVANDKRNYISQRVSDLIRKDKLSSGEAFKKAKEEVNWNSLKDGLAEKYNNKTAEGNTEVTKKKYKDEDMVTVEGPNGIETMTYAQAKKLGAE